MFPLSEFPFAFCGIATVAATLGYACARRAVLSLASPNESSKAEVKPGPPEERSLKRKLDDSDAHVQEQPRPIKRNRTPPTDQHESDEDFYQEWEVIVAPPPPYEQAVGLRHPEEPVQDKSTPPPQGDEHTFRQEVAPLRESTPAAHPETSPQPEEKKVDTGPCATPPPLDSSPNEPETPSTHPMTPRKPTVPAEIESVNVFSAFSGSSSPFASYSNSSGASPFALSSQIVRSAPAWRLDNGNKSDVFGRPSSVNDLVPSLNDAVPHATTKSPALSQCKDALAALSETQPLAKSFTCVTGEEDETIEAELKGVKLFIKRGRKEFTDGMYGHIKILAKQSTPQKTGNEDPLGTEAETTSRTRLLFRRDPLGQVSMNVGLHPAVTTDGKDSKEDVVIYALKPGRVQKPDFQSFAKTLCDHEGLKSRVVTGPATLASGAAAAS